MPQFRIHDQAQQGNTIALKSPDVAAVRALAGSCTGRSRNRIYVSLQDYLDNTRIAINPPEPYERRVDVIWDNPRFGLATPLVCQDRVLVATYSGNVRRAGGFASQCYLVLDPLWDRILRVHLRTIVDVDFIAGRNRDTLIVR